MKTTLQSLNATVSQGELPPEGPPLELVDCYQSLLRSGRFAWTVHQHLLRVSGRGGQGIVYLSERRGSDHFTVPIALKVFSPERYRDTRTYEQAMARHGARGRPCCSDSAR